MPEYILTIVKKTVCLNDQENMLIALANLIIPSIGLQVRGCIDTFRIETPDRIFYREADVVMRGTISRGMVNRLLAVKRTQESLCNELWKFFAISESISAAQTFRPQKKKRRGKKKAVTTA